MTETTEAKIQNMTRDEKDQLIQELFYGDYKSQTLTIREAVIYFYAKSIIQEKDEEIKRLKKEADHG